MDTGRRCPSLLPGDPGIKAAPHMHLYSDVIRKVGTFIRRSTLRETVGLSIPEFRTLQRKFCTTRISVKPKKLTQSEFDQFIGKSEIPAELVKKGRGGINTKDFKVNFTQYQLPEGDLPLVSLRCLQNRSSYDKLYIRKKQKSYPGAIELDLKHRLFKEESKVVQDLQPYGKDYLLAVRIYCPSKPKILLFPKLSDRDESSLQVSQEFYCLSTQSLDTLRDRIICAEDFQATSDDISEDPFAPVYVRKKDLDKSSFFFIGDTFYIDMRDPDNIDISKNIRLTNDKNVKFKEPLNMQDVLFEDLTFRFGYPYLYTHLTSCEHLVVFTQARLIGGNDFLLSASYPTMKSFMCARGKYCALCGHRVAKYIVKNCARVPLKSMYICLPCVYHFLYDENMKKIGHFQLYHYTDRAAIL